MANTVVASRTTQPEWRYPVLATKLFIPTSRAECVHRPRLLDLVDEAFQRTLTVISAPPGFGKTTLLVDWHRSARSAGRAFAWLSLDERDNDPIRFVTYVIHALRMVAPGIGEQALGMLHGVQRPDLEIPLTVLLNDLELLDQPVVLVLDDYHEITNPDVHTRLTFLIDHLPPGLRVAITARADPPLALARLRGRRELGEIGIEDLRFTAGEATTFLNDVMGLDLSVNQVERLEERTEGWIAGLLLAALSVDNPQDRDAIIAEFTGEHYFVFDYLAEEVLSRQSEDVQSFLLQSSVLSEMSVEVANVVTGRCDSRDMLEFLEQSNLFLIPLDHTRTWYRYHHLFGEFLGSRLRREQPDVWRTTGERAADWYRDRGWWHQAIEQALAIEDFERVTQFIERSGFKTVKNGRTETLNRWFEAIPDVVINRSPGLGVLRAWSCLIDRRVDDADQLLQSVEASEGEYGLDGDLDIQIALIRIHIAVFREELDDAIDLAQRTLPDIHPDDDFSRSMVLVHLGMALRMKEDLEAAVRVLTEAADLSLATDNPLGWLPASSQRAVAWMTLGDLNLAHGAYRHALDFEAQHGLQSKGFAIAAHLGLAEILREWNLLDEAEDVVRNALAILHAINRDEETGTLVYGYLVLARIQFGQGKYEDSLASTEEALQEAANRGLGAWQRERLVSIRARILLALGRIDEVREWRRSYGYQASDTITVFSEVAYQTLTRLYLAEGELDEADMVLRNLQQLARSGGRRSRLIGNGILEALLAERRGKNQAALDHLGQSLRLAEPDGYVRAFADEGTILASLLQTIREADPERYQVSPGYLRHIIQALGDTDVAAAPGGGPPAGTPNMLAGHLTERELEVLALLTKGLSNREIADQLFLSVGTIKRHTHNIYGKLDVRNRTQAIVRGQDLGLLE